MPLYLRFLFPLVFLPLLAGCHRAAMHVRVPHGFHGQVVVDCDSSGEAGPTVLLDEQGHGRAAECPSDEAKVFLDRDGSSTMPENVQWIRTGDGLVTQLRLSVR